MCAPRKLHNRRRKQANGLENSCGHRRVHCTRKLIMQTSDLVRLVAQFALVAHWSPKFNFIRMRPQRGCKKKKLRILISIQTWTVELTIRLESCSIFESCQVQSLSGSVQLNAKPSDICIMQDQSRHQYNFSAGHCVQCSVHTHSTVDTCYYDWT